MLYRNPKARLVTSSKTVLQQSGPFALVEYPTHAYAIERDDHPLPGLNFPPTEFPRALSTFEEIKFCCQPQRYFSL